jgi:phosphoenolpyruvate carboxylase
LQVSTEEKEQQVEEKRQRQRQQHLELQADPMAKFMYALKAKESKRQYPRRFKMFLDYLKLDKVVTLHPSHVKRLDIDDFTFFIQKPVENGILLQMRKLDINRVDD